MIIDEYIGASNAYGSAIRSGDSRASEEAFKQVEMAFRKLKESGVEWQDALSRLLSHPEESVRLWSSAHLLNYRSKEAESTLRKIIDDKSILGLTAEVALDQWKAGQIKY